MADTPNDETYSEEEAVRRREAAIKVMLNTPHRPHKPLGKTAKEKGAAAEKRR